MVQTIIMTNNTPEQNKRLLDAINRRKYTFNSNRAGFNIPHVSEFKFFLVRAKKEVMPYVLRDLKCDNLNPKEKITLWQIIRMKKALKDGQEAFFSGRIILIMRYIMQLITWISRRKIDSVEIAKGECNPFVEGWTYAWAVGNIKDIERFPGNEEL